MINTYINKNGTPIIRKCGNCINYKHIDTQDKSGYCKVKPLYFAFTHEKSVYGIVKDFYLCEEHKLLNEDILEFSCEPIDLKSYLMDRNAKKRLF
jgi:hypothetical protein